VDIGQGVNRDKQANHVRQAKVIETWLWYNHLERGIAMASALPFAEVLDAIDHLSAEEQEMLISIAQRRLAERGRKQVVNDVQDARREFADGGCRPIATDDLLREISS
jgi:hypothetical protein